MPILEDMIEFAKQIQTGFDKGKSLNDIRYWTFMERERGRNVPYMPKLDVDSLCAAPTVKQRELTQFFGQTAKDCKVLKRYTLMVFAKGGVQFCERVSRTRQVNLLTGESTDIK